MLSTKRLGSLAISGTFLVALLTGCAASTDRRLTEDQQSCQAMGHTTGTANFRQCLADLDERRCAMSANMKNGALHHVASADCSRLH